MVPFNPLLLSVVGSNAWSHLHPCTFVCCGVKLILPFRPVLLSVVGSNPWSDLHPVLVMKSMVPFTPCNCVFCGVKSMVPFTPCACCVYCGIYMLYVSVVGSNPWSHLHPVLVSVWGQIYGPIYTLYLSQFMVKSMVPFIPVLLSVVGSNPWSHLHPVLVMKSMVPFTPFT